MTKYKNILFIILTSCFLVFSSTASAGEENVAGIKVAIKDTIAKVQEAIDALAKGEEAQKVGELIVEARQLQKSISTSDSKVSMKRSSSNNKLVKARKSVLDGDNKSAADLLNEALAGYKEVEEKFNATH
jgi:hypothetical protein